MAVNIDPKWHAAQIKKFVREHKRYEIYAETLRKILDLACQSIDPLANVQARAKSVSSFAEKAARKAFKYADPVHQITDLCGARIVVHTLDQVDRVCTFIRENFKIDESNSLDQRSVLRTREFGYRAVHFVVQVKSPSILGIEVPLRTIDDRKAEIQVQTLLQHTWADIGHDRLYKGDFKVPEPMERESGRLAAVMEDADASFGRLAEAADAFHINYGGYLDAEKRNDEIQMLLAVLRNEPEKKNRPQIALRLARLAKAAGDWPLIIESLKPHAGTLEPCRNDIRIELGYAMCRSCHDNPNSRVCTNGRRYLEQVSQPDKIVANGTLADVVAKDAMRARAFFLLAGSYRGMGGKKEKVRDLYYKAFLCDSLNPYYLAAFLEFEVCRPGCSEFLSMIRPQIEAAVAACRFHAELRIELPWAFFAMGFLHLLSGRTSESLAAYARAIQWSPTAFPIEQALVTIEHLLEERCFKEPGLEWTRRFLLLGLAAKCRRLSEVAVKAVAVKQQALDDANRALEEIKRQDATKAKELKGAENKLQAATEAAEKAKAEASVFWAKAKAALKRVKKLRTKQSHFEDLKECPILFVAGGCDPTVKNEMRSYDSLIRIALRDFRGTVFSGGTNKGVPGLVAEAKKQLEKRNRCGFKLRAYVPHGMWHLCSKAYDPPIYKTRGKDFSVTEPLQNWTDLLAAGVDPAGVRVFGINGGPIAEFEYRLALAMGATVGVVESSGRAATAVLPDVQWWPPGHIVQLPRDLMTILAFVCPPSPPQPDLGDKFAIAASRSHEDSLKENRHKAKDPTMLPWNLLRDDLRRDNLNQMAYAERILREVRCGIRLLKPGEAAPSVEFSDKEVEKMAEMEHGRWVAERLDSGWTYSTERDPENKKSPYLVGWKDLPDAVRKWDRDIVRCFPPLFRDVGLVIYRLPKRR